MEKCARFAKHIYEQANNWKLMLVWLKIKVCIYIYIISLQVRRSSLTMALAKDQGLRGPLVYLSLIELSPYSPHVHRCQAFSTLEIFRGHCAAPPVLWHQSHKWHYRKLIISVQCWIWLEAHLNRLMHDWEAQCVQSPPDHSPEWAFPICNEKPLRTDIPEHMQSKFVAQESMILHKFPKWKNGS
jgi:hypothetical protein